MQDGWYSCNNYKSEEHVRMNFQNTGNRYILVWLKFGAFAPKWGGFILVCLILALWLSDVIRFGALVYDVIMLRGDAQSTHIWLH